MTTIAIFGAGAMGTRIARNLLSAGYPVLIYNRTPNQVTALLEQGAAYAATPREAAAQADILISLVTDDEASRAVWLTPETGAIAGLEARTTPAIALESSTLTVSWVQTLGQALAARDIPFLDAPMVGSRPQAEAAKLTYLVGGPAAALAAVEPILLVSGSVQHVGDLGQGMAMKLAVNALFGIQVAALAELLCALEQQGLSRAQAMAGLGALPVTSPAAKAAGSLMVGDRHSPLFPIRLVEKDFHYARQLTDAAPLPLCAAAQAIYQEAIERGYGDDNITGVVQRSDPAICVAHRDDP